MLFPAVRLNHTVRRDSGIVFLPSPAGLSCRPPKTKSVKKKLAKNRNWAKIGCKFLLYSLNMIGTENNAGQSNHLVCTCQYMRSGSETFAWFW